MSTGLFFKSRYCFEYFYSLVIYQSLLIYKALSTHNDKNIIILFSNNSTKVSIVDISEVFANVCKLLLISLHFSHLLQYGFISCTKFVFYLLDIYSYIFIYSVIMFIAINLILYYLFLKLFISLLSLS